MQALHTCLFADSQFSHVFIIFMWLSWVATVDQALAHDTTRTKYYDKGSSNSYRIFLIQVAASYSSHPSKSLYQSKMIALIVACLSRWGTHLGVSNSLLDSKEALRQYRCQCTSNFTRSRAAVTRSCVLEWVGRSRSYSRTNYQSAKKKIGSWCGSLGPCEVVVVETSGRTRKTDWGKGISADPTYACP